MPQFMATFYFLFFLQVSFETSKVDDYYVYSYVHIFIYLYYIYIYVLCLYVFEDLTPKQWKHGRGRPSTTFVCILFVVLFMRFRLKTGNLLYCLT